MVLPPNSIIQLKEAIKLFHLPFQKHGRAKKNQIPKNREKEASKCAEYKALYDRLRDKVKIDSLLRYRRMDGWTIQLERKVIQTN